MRLRARNERAAARRRAAKEGSVSSDSIEATAGTRGESIDTRMMNHNIINPHNWTKKNQNSNKS